MGVELGMRYISLCSGIEAASVAWPNWSPVAFSEIDPFPAAVLKHRFPDVPNWGDMTKFEEWPYVPIDLVCGGTPCQSFSVAGLRKGLDDPRGDLMLTFGHILGKYRPTWFVWENVPGVLSSDAGRDFASFLELVTGQIVKPPKDDSGWRNAGAISGIDSAYGCSWRVLDAQYTRSPNHPRAVPQRRRRVFVVGHLGDWRRAAAVLLDSESLSRNPTPRREAGQRVAGTLKGGSGERGYPDPSDGNGGGLVEAVAFQQNTRDEVRLMSGDGQIAGALSAEPGMKQQNYLAVYENHPQDSRITELDGVCSTVHSKYGTGGGNVPLVAHTLSADGFDASEDGTGRGTPIVPTKWPAEVAPTLNAHFGDKQGLEDQHALNGAGLFVPVAIQGTIIGRSDKAGPQGSGVNDDGAMFTLTKTDQHAVAIRTAQTSANGHGIADDVAHTPDGVQGQAIAMRQREGKPGGGKGPLIFEEHSGTLATSNDQTLLTPAMAVRRLLPVECERLQGFPDGWTLIPWRIYKEAERKGVSYESILQERGQHLRDPAGDDCPDGPRYKAIGNSMATNCMEWIGLRIDEIRKVLNF